MKIGLRAHDLGKAETAPLLADKISEMGFESTQLVLHKALISAPGPFETVPEEYARNTGKAFREKGVDIALLGGYFDWFHDTEGKGKARFKELLDLAGAFGARRVGSEAQGVTHERWAPNPLNETTEAFDKAVETARELAEAAEKAGAEAAFEGAVHHVLSSPGKVRRLFEKVNSGSVVLIFDLFNFLSYENRESQRRIMDEALEIYEDKLKIIHCKDFIPKSDKLEQTGLGQGLFDYEYLFNALKGKDLSDVTLIFEGVAKEDMESSLAFIQQLKEKILG